MDRIIQHKTIRVAQEWNSGKLDNRVCIIIYALAGFVFNRFEKILTITEIWRSDAEQDAYYANYPAYKQQPWKSTHQDWRAADVRAMVFTADELKAIDEFLNNNFFYNKEHKVCVVHDVGLGLHIHIQVDGDGVTEIKSRGVNPNA